MIKKIMFSMLLMLVCIPVFAASTPTFYYDSEKVEDMWINKVSNTENRSVHPYLLKKRGDDTYVYCLEAFTFMKNDSKYIYDSNYSKYGLTKKDMDRINLLIYYGYGYKNHTSDRWYGITQYLIWQLTDKDSDIYFSKEKNGKKEDLYRDEINEIESLINKHLMEPNFIKDYIISTNSVLQLDSNIDLSNYSIESNAKYELKDNKLLFKNLDVGNYFVKLKRNDNRFKNSYMLYYSDESQNIIIPGDNSIFKKEYSFNIEVKEGSLNLVKRDEDKTYLAGAKYGVYSDEKLIKELVTDSNGRVKTNLPFGKYILKEIEAPYGYELDNKVYEFEISDDSLNVNKELTDSKIYIDLNISKKSSYNNKYLSGATYGIYKDNKLIDKIVTNDSFVTIKLPYGEYEVKELIAPPGYKVDSSVHKVVIDGSESYNLNLVDEKIVVDVPNTGLKKSNIVYLPLILGIIGLLYGKKKYYVH